MKPDLPVGRRLSACLLLLAAIWAGAPLPAHAYTGGIYASQMNSDGCLGCHKNGGTSTVTFPSAELNLEPNASKEYTVRISMGSTTTSAGFALKKDNGTLAIPTGEVSYIRSNLAVSELTHTTTRKPTTLVNGAYYVDFKFKFTAPATRGTTSTISVWGNAVNKNNSNSGDSPSALTKLFIRTKAAAGGQCSSTAQCTTGLSCVNNVCCKQASCPGGDAICTSAPYCDGAGNCVLPTRNEGLACNDGNGCTVNEICTRGSCGGGQPRVCTASDECHVAGSCVNGACTDPLKANGSACTGSSATNECVGPGTCQSGACQNPPEPLGTECDDAQMSTLYDACNGAGMCVGSALPGNVYIWGDGSHGQLGDGRSGVGVIATTPQRYVMPSIVNAASGGEHTLLIRADSNGYAFGANNYGQLGLHYTSSAQDPDVELAERVYENDTMISAHLWQVAAGATHTLIATRNGKLYASGSNTFGELGFSGLASPEPRAVALPSPVISVAAGVNFSVAVRADGTVWTWGKNSEGQLGLGDTTARSTPVQVTLPVRVKAVAAGAEHVYALATNGQVYAWGSNWRGAIAQPSSVARSLTPVRIDALAQIRSIASGHYHGLAIRYDGRVWSWGDNTLGQLAQSASVGGTAPPAQIGGLTNVIQVVAGAVHSAALRADGTVAAWGDNTTGQLGSSGVTFSSTPRDVPGLSYIKRLASGDYTLIAIASQGRVATWGTNYHGQLGVGQTGQQLPYSSLPVPVTGLPVPIKQVALGSVHALALAADGTVWGWGYNNDGVLGLSDYNLKPNVPVQVSGLSNVVAVMAGSSTSFALLADGRVLGWGNNSAGQLGDGTFTSGHVARYVGNATDLVEIHTVLRHTLGLRATGEVVSWGDDTVGSFGVYTAQVIPLSLGGITTARSVGTGASNSYAVLADGKVAAWGANDFGQLGNGTTGSRQRNPQLVSGLADVTKVSGGTWYTIALSKGKVYGWGRNNYGQLTSGATDPQLTPIVTYYPYDISPGFYVDIAAGSFANYALDWRPRSLGRGDNGALGNGGTVSSSSLTGELVGSVTMGVQVAASSEYGAIVFE